MLPLRSRLVRSVECTVLLTACTTVIVSLHRQSAMRQPPLAFFPLLALQQLSVWLTCLPHSVVQGSWTELIGCAIMAPLFCPIGIFEITIYKNASHGAQLYPWQLLSTSYTPHAFLIHNSIDSSRPCAAVVYGHSCTFTIRGNLK